MSLSDDFLDELEEVMKEALPPYFHMSKHASVWVVELCQELREARETIAKMNAERDPPLALPELTKEENEAREKTNSV